MDKKVAVDVVANPSRFRCECLGRTRSVHHPRYAFSLGELLRSPGKRKNLKFHPLPRLWRFFVIEPKNLPFSVQCAQWIGADITVSLTAIGKCFSFATALCIDNFFLTPSLSLALILLHVKSTSSVYICFCDKWELFSQLKRCSLPVFWYHFFF